MGILDKLFTGKNKSKQDNASLDLRKGREDRQVENQVYKTNVGSSANVKTTLFIHPALEPTISNVNRQIMEDDLAVLSPIKEKEIKVDGIYAYDTGNQIEVSCYIRNGHSTPVAFEDVQLAIMDDRNMFLGIQSFNLRILGEIPPYSAMPWKLYFDKENVNVSEVPREGWRIIFITPANNEVTIEEYENLPDYLSEYDIARLYDTLKSLPTVKQGKINFTGIQAIRENDGSIFGTVIIRNGSNKQAIIEKIPLTLIDANKKEVASGMFSTGELRVNPLKAIVWNFKFPSEKVVRENIDLSSWSIDIKNA